MVTGHTEIKLKMGWMFSLYWLVFTVPKDAAFTVSKAAAENTDKEWSSRVGPSCDS